MKVVKRINSKNSHHKEKFFVWGFFFCFSIYCIYMRRWMLTKLITVIILQNVSNYYAIYLKFIQ